MCVWGLAAFGLFTAGGCANTGMITRGQSPSAYQQASFGYRGPIHEVATDHFHDRDVSYYNTHGQSVSPASQTPYGPGCPQGACPPGYGGAQGCPPGGGCPSGMCGQGGACNFPRHAYSFSYERPNDLVYPPANVPGGAVAYPYYTCRGPSDFFRDDPSRQR